MVHKDYSFAQVEMHHIRQIKDLRGRLHLDWFQKQMAAINRKQIPLCRSHHQSLHLGTITMEERLRYEAGVKSLVRVVPPVKPS